MRKIVKGWCVVNDKHSKKGLLTLDHRIPIFWVKKQAEMSTMAFGGLVVPCTITYETPS